MAVKTDPSSIWSDLTRGLEYQASIGIVKDATEAVKFKEGDQWPPSTERTKYAAKPVINQCDYTIEIKKSNILSQSLKMIYEPEELPQSDNPAEMQKKTEELNAAAQDMTDMAQNTWNDIDEEELNDEWVDDALTTGTGIKHYYFDNSFNGGVYTTYIGKMCGETIDVLDIFFANPQLKPRQTQKQPWILIRTREDTDAVIAEAKANKGETDKIKPDEDQEEKYDNAQKDMAEPNKTTCLTKYYRQDGQIYRVKACKDATILPARPLSPGDITLDDGKVIKIKPFKLYPIDILVFKKRKKCIYGISVLKDMIPVQKMINFIYGMIANSIQDVAWPKIIAKMGALLEPITNVPGEILTDHFASPGIDGFKFMQPPNFSHFPIDVSDKLIEMQRQRNGTHDVITGEMLGANMAAAAIIALQNQAKKPVEADQKKLFRAEKNCGLIWQEFYKCYYNMPRPIQGKDEEGKDITKIFDGSKYAEMGFGLTIDIGPASVFSETLQMTILDSYAERGWIDKYQHAKYAPRNAIPQELRSDFEKEEEQMRQQQELQTQQQAMIDEAISKLLPEELAELEANPQLMDEFVNSIMGGMPNGQGM
jgi:hypothetical protein